MELEFAVQGSIRELRACMAQEGKCKMVGDAAKWATLCLIFNFLFYFYVLIFFLNLFPVVSIDLIKYRCNHKLMSISHEAPWAEFV